MTRPTWFIIGLSAGCAATIVALYAHTHTSMGGVPIEMTDLSLEWSTKAHIRRMGEFIVAHPEDTGIGSIVIYHSSRSSPRLYVHDELADGVADEVWVFDREGQYLVVEDTDNNGSFDQYSLGAADTTYTDENMDGQFDNRFVGNEFAVMIDGRWRDVITEQDGDRFVELEGERKQIKYDSGIWSIDLKEVSN